MARARNIKPGFFTNGDLLECSPLARLLFIGLWCEADRRGILKDHPKSLKAKILPGDNCDVEELLTELADRDFIRRYEVDGVRCILVTNFAVHQHPHVKEQANTLPAPDASPIDGKSIPDKPGANPVHAPDESGINPSDPLNTDTSTPPNPPTGGETADEGESDDEPDDPLSTLAGRFDAFWAAYPKKVGKDAARKVWDRRKPDQALTQLMLTAIAEQLASEAWTRDCGRFIPNPATWLNQGRWQDEPITVNGRASPGLKRPPPPIPDELKPFTIDPLLRELARQRQQKAKQRTGVVVPAVLERYDRDIGEIDQQLRERGVTPEEAERWALRQ